MDRLTEKRDGKNVIPLRNSVCGVDMPDWSLCKDSDIQTFLYGDAADRLAAYEDTGLEPQDVPTGLEMANVFAIYQKLKEYEKAEEQGLLVMMPPCNVGDTVYVLLDKTYGIQETKVNRILLIGGYSPKYQIKCKAEAITNPIRIKGGMLEWTFRLSDVGKTVFRTPEEAEAALKARAEQ